MSKDSIFNNIITSVDFESKINPTTIGFQSLKGDNDWYSSAIFYHIFVASFCDSNDDGIGDLEGIRSKLPYLQSLGVNAIFLSPIFLCASVEPNLHGYDTIDYYKIDPRFGTEDDLINLLNDSHRIGFRVIFDFVPNHTSIYHEWFKKSSEGEAEYLDWYTWSKEPIPGWKTVYEKSAFHKHRNGKYYYSVYAENLADLNFNNINVQSEIANVLIYWLNFGFDGVRVDAATYLSEDWRAGELGRENIVKNIHFFTELRKIADVYDQLGFSKFMIGEHWVNELERLSPYWGTAANRCFHALFDFPGAALLTLSNPALLADHSRRWFSEAEFRKGIVGTFLTNHDQVVARPATQFYFANANEDKDKFEKYALGRTKLALATQLTSAGVPFLYYGNEMGMVGGHSSPEELRQKMNWSRALSETQNTDGLYRFIERLIRLRERTPTLRTGTFSVLNCSDPMIYSYLRGDGYSQTIVVMNYYQYSVEDIQIILPSADIELRYIDGSRSEFQIIGNILKITAITGFGFLILSNTDSKKMDSIYRRAEDDYFVEDIFIRGTLAGPNPDAGWKWGKKMTKLNSEYFEFRVGKGFHTFKFFHLPGGWVGPNEGVSRVMELDGNMDEGLPINSMHSNFELVIPSNDLRIIYLPSKRQFIICK